MMMLDRLLNVAKALRESPNPERFTMQKVLHPDGAPACAWGHYVSRGDLQNEFTPFADDFYGSTIRGTGHPACTNQIAQHFGVEYAQVCELFGQRGCDDAKTPIEAAQYIEALVERNRPILQRVFKRVVRVAA